MGPVCWTPSKTPLQFFRTNQFYWRRTQIIPVTLRTYKRQTNFTILHFISVNVTTDRNRTHNLGGDRKLRGLSKSHDMTITMTLSLTPYLEINLLEIWGYSLITWKMRNFKFHWTQTVGADHLMVHWQVNISVISWWNQLWDGLYHSRLFNIGLYGKLKRCQSRM